MRRRSAAFTMIEMLAVMLLLGILIAGVVNFYIQISRESNVAASATRSARRGTAVVDRIARELESSILIRRPDGTDPLDHPWLFFAGNDRGGEGSDRIRFVTRSRRPSASARNESDLAVVAYALREGDQGDLELVRWASPHLPEGLDRRIPDAEEDGAQVLAEGVLDFGLRFLSGTGDWKEAWDSSSIVDSNELPVAAEIRVALADPEAPEDETREPPTLTRQVLLPVRPLDLEALLTSAETEADPDAPGEEGASEEEEEEADEERQEGCITVTQCLASNPDLDLAPALAAAGLPPSVVSTIGDQCASEFSSFVALPGNCL